jgi:glucose uptake protein
MILPQSYAAALFLMFLCALCWGSWANTYKLTAKWRFELYYFDWVFGALLVAVILALTAGSLGYDGFSFLDDIQIAGKRAWLFGFLAGVIFNLGNMFLMASLAVAGMAVAFPVALGISIVVGTVVNFAVHRSGAVTFLLLGSGLLVGAVVAAVMAYRHLLILRHEEIARAGKAKSTRRPASWKAIVLAAVGGVLLGSFAPLIEGARAGEIGMGPYSLALLFAVGVTASTLMFNLFFMNLPVEGEPLEIPHYFRGAWKNHLLGLAGGALWSVGLVAAFVASAAPEQARPGPSLVNALSQSAALLAAAWGLVLWKEFRGADGRVKVLEALALLLFAGGVGLLAVAPLFAAK